MAWNGSEIRDDILDEVDEIIEDKFNTTWYAEDFLQAYMDANGIKSEEAMTNEEWIKFKDKMNEPGFLSGFRQACVQDVNERIGYLF